MRADNTQHVIAAARSRAEQTRQRAVATLRPHELHWPAHHLRLRRSRDRRLQVLALRPGRPTSRDRATPTAAPDCSIGSGPSPATAPQIPHCCAGWRRRPPASAGWRPTTSNSATHSPEHSANSAPLRCSDRQSVMTRRTATRRTSSAPAESAANRVLRSFTACRRPRTST